MFTRARLKLTAWYLLIITLISVSFSLVIYRVISLEVERFIYSPRLYGPRIFLNQPPPTQTELSGLVDNLKQRFLINLITVNGGIILLSGSFAYFLAGRTLKPIQTMVDDQNRFISDASHEIRTPLTSLKSAFEVYLRDPRPTLSEAKTLIKESVEEVNKLQSLSDGMLELTRYQDPESNFNPQPVEIKQIISTAVSRTKPIAVKKRIKVNLSIGTHTIKGDFDKLVSLFVIFLDNALKYSPANSKIIIKTTTTDKNLTVSIQDFGAGIPQKDLPHIFDRFYRSDTARTKNGVGGYGLGLSIAQKIVKLHHARIDVYSQVNQGSTFSVIFQH